MISFDGGILAIVEAAYTANPGQDAKAPQATFKLGGWYHTSGHFGDQRFDTRGQVAGRSVLGCNAATA